MTRRTLFLGGGAAALSAQTSKPVNVGLIGAGHRAWAHIAVLKAIPDFRIVGIADPTPEFLQRAAKLAGPDVATYPDYTQLLQQRKELDAVFVVTPGGLHVEPTVAAFERGLHVLSEKPMATSIAGANLMLAASEKAGRILQIGQQMRYTPLYQKVFELRRAGEIGTIQFVAGNLFRGDWNPKSWQVADPGTGKPTIWRFLTRYTGSSLLEDGIHEIDVLNWIVGSRVHQVYATGGNNVLKERETIDHAALVLDYENGVKFQFGFSIFAPTSGASGRQMTFIGTEGSITVEQNQITLRQRGSEPRRVEVANDAPAGLLQQQVGRDLDIGTYRQSVAFLDSVRTGRKPVCDGQVGREVIHISLLGEKSVRERRVVRWDELEA